MSKKSPPVPKKKGAFASCIGIFIFFVVAIVAIYFFGKNLVHKSIDNAILANRPMAEERANHIFQRIRPENYAPDGPPDVPPPDIFQLITYTSEVGNLAAYLTPNPGDGKKHPVMIWSKGGFGGIGKFLWENSTPSNDQSVRAFVDAGIVVMCPSYRGENANPGDFELFYGELNDFLAAVKYAKSLPWVDPDRVYIGGHHTGGTLALLAAGTGLECRAIISLSGAPTMATVMSDGEGYGNTPYNPRSYNENQMRSAIRYTKFIKTPTFYIEGGAESFYWNDAKLMQNLADRFNIPFHSYNIAPANTYNILAPFTALIAQKILADTPITMNQQELETEWVRFFSQLER